MIRKIKVANLIGLVLIILLIKIDIDMLMRFESRGDQGILNRYVLIWFDAALFYYLITRIALGLAYLYKFREIRIFTAFKLAVLFYEIRFFLMAGGIVPQPNLTLKNLFIYLFT